MKMCKTAIEILTALEPLALTAFLIYIGCQQFKLNKVQVQNERRKLQFNLYDKRFKVFELAWEIIMHIRPEKDNSMEEYLRKLLPKLNRASISTSFLFKDDVHDYIGELMRKASRLHNIHGNASLEREQEKQEIYGWFDQQRFGEDIHENFKPYLNFTENLESI